MRRTLFLAPAGIDVGLTTVVLGLVRALDRCGVRVAFFKPVGQTVLRAGGVDRSTHFARHASHVPVNEPIRLERASRHVAEGQVDLLLGEVIRDYEQCTSGADLVVVEGLVASEVAPFAGELNERLVQALGADVVVVASLAEGRLHGQLELAARAFGGVESPRVVGCILNRVGAGADGDHQAAVLGLERQCQELRPGGLALIAAIVENPELTHCRASDLVEPLSARVHHRGEMEARRVHEIVVLARSVPNLLHRLRPGAVLVTPIDRTDVIVAVAHAALNRVRLAGLVLTCGHDVDPRISEFCRTGFETGLPVLTVDSNSYETASTLARMNREVPADDYARIQLSMDFVANHVRPGWLRQLPSDAVEVRFSPAAFCYQLTERARRANKRILLPEGSEPRTIRAALHCHRTGIARCVLLGSRRAIEAAARAEALQLPPELEILEPDEVRGHYVQPLVTLRRAKHLSPESAADQLTDPIVLGTVMLAMGEADGLVAGAVHSSANTVRPALQLIKARPGVRVVSSVFFMCLPDQVVVYGDCAVNTDPDAETLADIAIQSADSAAQFGIEPRVAMISYSTGESGAGAGVEKVREATRLARERRPDLTIDGPLQYDAAAIADVAAKKAAGSPVAGRATVFIFPDLNTGNTTYKAVQRSAHVVSIGPMLQGLKRPVNDLSRGALVEDIIYTIALTAVQAEATAR